MVESVFDQNSAERRVKPRRSSTLRAWADPGGVLPVIDCRVIDISESGARVMPVVGTDLPDHFTLQVNSSTIVGEARVVRRTEQFVGVEFVKRRAG